MATSAERRLRPKEIRRFGQTTEYYTIPSLTDIQTRGYDTFLQLDTAADKRKDHGIEGVLREIFPVESYDKTLKLEYLRYELGKPRVVALIVFTAVVGMFLAGYAELNAQLRQPVAAGSPAAAAPRPTLKSLAAVDRALLRASSAEVNKLEKNVTFLATTASITPFIGLFGTVWGIMSAFTNIGAQGSTDLSVVAPGIAEALIATAAGLFAAIPAVYFYNHLTTRVKIYASEMDDFALEFLNISERNFT